MKNLTKGNPIKLIIIFAIPLFIGQLFQLFYSLVDTRIIGSTLGDTALAAVGATTSLSDMLTWLLSGITSGFGIIISRYFGADDKVYMKNTIAWTIILSVLITSVLSFFGIVFLPQILGILNVSEELLPQSRDYIRIILAGLIANTLYNVCAAILRAIGDSFTPLLFLILATILNIFLDYIFILNFHLGVEGAAWATIISQAFSALLCFPYMIRRYPNLKLNACDFIYRKIVLKNLISTGLSMGFMVSLVSLGTIALQTSINTFGTNIIIAHTCARKITSMLMLPLGVLGTTLATYCGQNLGAGEYIRIKKGIKDSLILCFAWCIVAIILAYTISPQLIHLITACEIKEVIDTGSLYLRVNTLFYFITAIISLFRNSMQGFGDNKTPVFSSSLELFCKVVIAYFLAPIIGYMGIIVSEPIAWIIMVIPLIVNMIRNPIFKNTEISSAMM